MAETEVVVLGWQISIYSARVQIALAEKDIKYEYKEEELPHNKSPLLLKHNPVYKKVPVLIHNGRPVCESKIIVEYIDELWKDKSPLLPSDPYLRSQARFWADYTDDKICEFGVKLIKSSKGEEMEKASQELLGCLKVLEGELGEKPFFMGEAFGYVDIVFISYLHHFYAYETFGNFSLKNDFPKLFALVTKCMQRESVSKILVDPNLINEAITMFRKSLSLED